MKTHEFILENRFVRRVLVINDYGISTHSLVYKETGIEYARDNKGCEFLLEINGNALFGYKKSIVHIVDGNIQDSKYRLEFEKIEKFPEEIMRFYFNVKEIDAKIIVCYELPPNLPMIRKWIEVTAGTKKLIISKAFFEVLNAYPGNLTDVEFYTQHGQVRENRMFVTSGFNDVLQAHNPTSDDGWFMANTAPGPLNRFLVYPQWSETSIAVGYVTDAIPFQKYLFPGDTFISHHATTMLYRGAQNSSLIRNTFRKCVRRDLPNYIHDVAMYCTWIPFLKNINEVLLMELVECAATLGVSTFVLDDGWFTENDWEVDTDKFPNGLELISQKIHSLGMHFGLWFNIGTSYGIDNLQNENNALDANGNPKYAGFTKGYSVKCLASNHRNILAEKLCALAERYKIDYFKLDFSSIVSPYGLLATGCYSRSHAWHHDSLDAVLEQYFGIFWIREYVKKYFPHLILDFSFESFGTASPNIAALQSSELHHASNLNTYHKSLSNARDIRNVLYRFCTLIPNERIMGSLICLEDDNCIENLLTSLIGAPLIAGDIRKLSAQEIKCIRNILHTIKKLTIDQPFTEFVKLRKDYYIRARDWDGFARFNKNGVGIICLFKNESKDTPYIQMELDLLGEIVFRDLITENIIFETDAYSLQNGIPIQWDSYDSFRVFYFTPKESLIS